MNGWSRPAISAMLRLASRVKGPPPPVATASLVVALFAPLLVLLKRRLISNGDHKHPRASWATICAFADDQIGEAEAGRGPTRTVAVEMRYTRYSEWCAARGHTGVDLVLATALWKEVGRKAGKGGMRVALEPNIVPYHAEAGVAVACRWVSRQRRSAGAGVFGTGPAAHTAVCLQCGYNVSTVCMQCACSSEGGGDVACGGSLVRSASAHRKWEERLSRPEPGERLRCGRQA